MYSPDNRMVATGTSVKKGQVLLKINHLLVLLYKEVVFTIVCHINQYICVYI